MTFDTTKPVQLRDGRKARIICTDAKGPLSIIALYTCLDGTESAQFYREDGTTPYSRQDANYDLVNVPEKMWVNLYRCGPGVYHKTEQQAIQQRDSHREFIKRVEFEV